MQIVMKSEFMSAGNGLLYARIIPHFSHSVADLQVREGFIRSNIWIRIV